MTFFRMNRVSAGLAVLFSLTALGAHAEGTLKTGVDANYAPHAMRTLGGGIQGFNIDLGNALAAQLHEKIEVDGTEFSALIPGLLSKKYDFILAPVTVTPEKAKSLLFSEGYLNSDYTFVQKKDAKPITKLEDLKGMKIAVNKGSSYDVWASQNAEKYGFTYDVYGSNADAIQALLAGRADANMAGNTVEAWAAKQNPQIKTTYTITTGLMWSLAFRPDDKAGRDRISMALKCLKQNGTVVKLAQKWFGFTPDANSPSVKIVPGQGVPDLPGYDATPVKVVCN
ncbi:transporter substrate-binding domain-containing protein [Robbsia sp. KACC 23696]|uniref:transporter substrate-binding domain-containing protein n=1 Tax=Robbsia sp. KACC 23696 TaxID=3149231 RepID=UPI00325C2D72